MEHQINANLIHKWLRQLSQDNYQPMVAVKMTEAISADCHRIDVPIGEVSVRFAGPIDAHRARIAVDALRWYRRPLETRSIWQRARPICVRVFRACRLWVTPTGAKVSASYYSLIEKAKAKNIEPYNYLKFLIAKIATADTVEACEAMLPYNFK